MKIFVKKNFVLTKTRGKNEFIYWLPKEVLKNKYCRRYGIEKNKAVIPAKAGIQKIKMNKNPCVYLLASRRSGTLYIGVASDWLNSDCA